VIRLFLTASIVLAASDAFAIVRYMVQDMTCSEVREALQRDGVAVLYRKSGRSGVPLYDRYVANQSYCQAGQEVVSEEVPTADTDSCRVPKCLDRSRFGNR
jgi:hypothetical protein